MAAEASPGPTVNLPRSPPHPAASRAHVCTKATSTFCNSCYHTGTHLLLSPFFILLSAHNNPPAPPKPGTLLQLEPGPAPTTHSLLLTQVAHQSQTLLNTGLFFLRRRVQPAALALSHRVRETHRVCGRPDAGRAGTPGAQPAQCSLGRWGRHSQG